MKKILLMFVVLITSMANAQYFNFSCDPATVESELTEIYAKATPPTELGDLINNTSDTVEASNDSSDFFKSLGADSGYTVVSFSGDEIGFYFRIDAIDGPKIYSEVEHINTPASHRAFTLQIVKHIWDLLHPNYVALTPLEEAIKAMYDADTHPETLTSVINDAAGVAYDNRSAAADDPRLVFIAKLNKFGVVFEGFENQNDGNRYVTFVDDTIDPIQSPVDGVNVTTAQFQEWMLRIARNIWLYEHQDYIYEQREIDRIAEILAIDTVDGLSIQHTKLVQGSITNHQFFISNGDTANISEVSISGAVLNAYNDANFITKKAEVQTAYGVQSSNLTDRTNRINTLKNNGNGYVTVTHDYDSGRGDLFNISYGGSTLHEYADTHFGGLYVRLETLDSDQYNALSTAITGKVNDLNPTVAKELATIFAGDTAPVGSAPEWLPTALYAKANEQINGTARATLFKNSFLSAHGITITQDNLYLVLSENGWDHYINWGDYGPQGWTNMTPETYRALVFNVIKDGWKHLDQTFDDERGAIINNNFDTTGLDVKIETFTTGNKDWWIYFNDVAVISGGADYINDDENYNNEYTPNIHDAHMSEAVYQRLLVFVQYMIDNQSSLKLITGENDRTTAITNMAIGTFGAGVVYDYPGDGTTHYTFTKNGNSNADPVQTNWTHPAGTTLAGLTPDGFVKLYAKCRGILIGL